jgi:hypothetical protein
MKESNMKRVSVLVFLTLIVATIVPASTLATSRNGHRTAVSGSIQFAVALDDAGNPYILETPVGNKECAADILGTYTFTGSLEGGGLAFIRLRSHGPCGSPPYTFAEDGVIHGTFTGTIAGKTGSFSYRYTFALDAGSTWRGRIEILSGTAEFEGLRGRLRINSTDTATQDPYTGWITFQN